MYKPSLDQWFEDAKTHPDADKVGMYLFHCGVVRSTAKAAVRYGQEADQVIGMVVNWDHDAADAAISAAEQLEGVYYVRTWLFEGELDVGDSIMQVLIGGDTRPHTIAALEYLVDRLKKECVTEQEIIG